MASAGHGREAFGNDRKGVIGMARRGRKGGRHGKRK